MAKRTLADLYVVGEEVRITDGEGDDVVLWIQKMSPVEHKRALTKGGAARARKLALTRDKDSDEFLAARSDIMDFANDEDMVDLAFRDEIMAKRVVVEAEMQADDVWAKDDYLEGLLAAWEGEEATVEQLEAAKEEGETIPRRSAGLKEAYHDPDHDDHDEGLRVFDEIKRFNSAVEDRFAKERERIITDGRTLDRDELIDRATQKYLEQQASNAFLEEYQNWEMYLSVRRPEDHKKYYFATRDDLDFLEDATKAALTSHITRITVEPFVGKDSAGIPPSSPSAEQPSTEAEEPVSTPQASTE